MLFMLLVLLLFTLVGCSSGTGNQLEDEKDSEASPSIIPIEVQIPELSKEELYQQFQTIFDACGASLTSSNEQIAAEYSRLDDLAANMPEFPADYATLYDEWRSAFVSDLLEENEAVIKEYGEIISSLPLYSEGVPGLWESVNGLCYANYVDFEGDGRTELLLIALAPNTIDPGGTFTVTIYGNSNGHAKKIFENTYYHDFGEQSISLFKNNGRTYIGHYHWGGGTGLPIGNDYYTMENEVLSLCDSIQIIPIPYEEGSGYYSVFRSFYDTELTEEQYNSIIEKYTEEEVLLKINEWNVSFERGILTAPPLTSITVNGQSVNLNAEIYTEDGIIFAPMRPILEAMGIPIYVSDNGTQIFASTKRHTLYLCDDLWQWEQISGEYYMRFDNANIHSLPPKLVDGVIFIPLLPIVQAFGGTVEKNDSSKTIIIDIDIPLEDRMSEAEICALGQFTLEKAKQIAEQNGYKYVITADIEWDASFSCAGGEAIWTIYALPEESYVEYAESASCYHLEITHNGNISILRYPYQVN